jgi:hypothetical protein
MPTEVPIKRERMVFCAYNLTPDERAQLEALADHWDRPMSRITRYAVQRVLLEYGAAELLEDDE